jgi:arabinan endo-1,5-alpha-L-arabinosidase
MNARNRCDPGPGITVPDQRGFAAGRPRGPGLWRHLVLPLCILSGGLLGGVVAAQDEDSGSGRDGTRQKVEVLSLSGDFRTHDPTLIRDRRTGDWYVFCTGDPLVADGTIQVRRSRDLHVWEYVGNVFAAIPPWILQAIPGVTNLWAPEITEHEGTYYLYYAASTPGSNLSLIALATTTDLASGVWQDQGVVTRSQLTDDFNAIDPAFLQDETGTPHLAFGSFWSGIHMLTLQWPSGKLAPGQTGEPLKLADRFVPPNAIEGAALTHHKGWYYLFVSFDFCCQGVNSTYKIAVGRSRSPTGPFYDQIGTPLTHGGGTVILSEQGTRFGPGGPSIAQDYLAHHYYDGTLNGDFRLGIRRIVWSDDDWPVIANPVPGL